METEILETSSEPIHAYKTAQVELELQHIHNGKEQTPQDAHLTGNVRFKAVAHNFYYGIHSNAVCLHKPEHHAPVEGCDCGFYALSDKEKIANSLFSGASFTNSDAILDVELHGHTVMEGSRGYRGAEQTIVGLEFRPECSYAMCHEKAEALVAEDRILDVTENGFWVKIGTRCKQHQTEGVRKELSLSELRSMLHIDVSLGDEAEYEKYEQKRLQIQNIDTGASRFAPWIPKPATKKRRILSYMSSGVFALTLVAVVMATLYNKELWKTFDYIWAMFAVSIAWIPLMNYIVYVLRKTLTIERARIIRRSAIAIFLVFAFFNMASWGAGLGWEPEEERLESSIPLLETADSKDGMLIVSNVTRSAIAAEEADTRGKASIETFNGDKELVEIVTKWYPEIIPYVVATTATENEKYALALSGETYIISALDNTVCLHEGTNWYSKNIWQGVSDGSLRCRYDTDRVTVGVFKTTP